MPDVPEKGYCKREMFPKGLHRHSTPGPRKTVWCAPQTSQWALGPLGHLGTAPRASPPLIGRYLVESQIGYIQIHIQFGIDAAGRPATPAQGCAGWARNPKGPQITPFCHQLGRHPTVLDATSAEFRRISARRSLGGVPPPQSQLFFSPFRGQKMRKSQLLGFF